MKYYELVIYTDRASLEPVSSLLVANGIEGAVINDPGDFAGTMAKDEVQLNPKSMRPSVTVCFEDSYKMKRRMGFFRQALVDFQKKALNGEFGPDVECGNLTVETRIVNDTDRKEK